MRRSPLEFCGCSEIESLYFNLPAKEASLGEHSRLANGAQMYGLRLNLDTPVTAPKKRHSDHLRLVFRLLELAVIRQVCASLCSCCTECSEVGRECSEYGRHSSLRKQHVQYAVVSVLR